MHLGKNLFLIVQGMRLKFCNKDISVLEKCKIKKYLLTIEYLFNYNDNS